MKAPRTPSVTGNVCIYCGNWTQTSEHHCADCVQDGELVPGIGAGYRAKLDEQFDRVFRTADVE
ncbi:MAG: hypothetical protein FH747_13750 [Stenotrophomonas sp.]|uniref:hypothetical protein n=1 Tax=Stenotrophomonas sp. TaxID=69392 RepID=UPI001352DCEC|nr:hypothetical protein [Stenotrophomonas sp.]MTI74698.1 hypothetical protein [Stenotrophomonas sp.]